MVKPAAQLDSRPLAEKRASYIRSRAEARHASGTLSSPQGKADPMKKKAGVGAGAGLMPAPQSSAPTLMVHIPNSDLEDARVERDDRRDGASSGDDKAVADDAGRTDDWVTVPGSENTESGTSASSPRRLPAPPIRPGLEDSPTRSTRDLRTKSWLMTAVGRMWGEEKERGKTNEDEDLESGQGSEVGVGAAAAVKGAGLTRDGRAEWDGSQNGGRDLEERGDAADRRFVSAATADSGRPAFL